MKNKLNFIWKYKMYWIKSIFKNQRLNNVGDFLCKLMVKLSSLFFKINYRELKEAPFLSLKIALNNNFEIKNFIVFLKKVRLQTKMRII